MSMQYRWVSNRKATKQQAIEDLAIAMVDLAKKVAVDKVIPKTFSFYETAWEAESQAMKSYPKYCFRNGDMEMNDWPANVSDRWFVPALVMAARLLTDEGYTKEKKISS